MQSATIIHRDGPTNKVIANRDPVSLKRRQRKISMGKSLPICEGPEVTCFQGANLMGAFFRLGAGLPMDVQPPVK